MPDDLYWDDTLLWSEQQAARLRRLAAGERVRDVDWEHVIEEIEDVGNTELRACKSLLRRAIEHLLKLGGWPCHSASEHWRAEALVFLRDAMLAFSPSMRLKLDLADLYRLALSDVRAITVDGARAGALPDACPFVLDDLLTEDIDLDALVAGLRQPPG
jgi:hypothetical protein